MRQRVPELMELDTKLHPKAPALDPHTGCLRSSARPSHIKENIQFDYVLDSAGQYFINEFTIGSIIVWKIPVNPSPKILPKKSFSLKGIYGQKLPG